MISRKLKSTYYWLTGPLMYFNGEIKRIFKRYKGITKVHLGPGQKNYLKGWINVDANIFTSKPDIWADLRNRLPFSDNSVDFFYSHHVIEHLPDLQFHFNEMYRCLKKNGRIRVGGPDGDAAIEKFINKEESWFSDFPDKRNSIGGKLENFIFCRKEHLTILTYSWLEELALNAGFSDIKKCKPKIETNFNDIVNEEVLNKEYENDFNFPHTLLIEAIK
jgi:predicted SAM-dependent methyltransferase